MVTFTVDEILEVIQDRIRCLEANIKFNLDDKNLVSYLDARIFELESLKLELLLREV